MTTFEERRRILFLGLPWTFTKYTVQEDLINVKKGFFTTIENDCYMYKIMDVRLETSFVEKILRLGTVICYTGVVTDPTLRLEHIKNARAVKDFILHSSEKERMRKRTLTARNIMDPHMEVDLNKMDDE